MCINPASELYEALLVRGWTLSLAESCTGGGVSVALTDCPGISQVYLGSVVAYANSIKVGVLGIDPRVLDQNGAVSSPVALAMAQGVQALFNSTIALSVTGIAGPGGGTPEKPVGTVWLGLVGEGVSLSRHLTLKGNRKQIQDQSVQEALDWVFSIFFAEKS